MINADEIASILKAQIADFRTEIHEDQVGTVIEVGSNIARVYGLAAVQQSELVEFPNGLQGICLNLEEDNVGVVVMGSDAEIKEGMTGSSRTGRIASVPVGEAMLGRVVNPLGEPIDGKGRDRRRRSFRTIENVAPTVVERQPVKQPMPTGIRAIDALIPIGKGQRELIIGDRSHRQDRDRDRHDPEPEGPATSSASTSRSVRRARPSPRSLSILETRGAMEYTTIVSDEPLGGGGPALKYIAPVLAGCAMAEESDV